ncbi:MAG: helix-turn-helix domain-containing protein [Acidimicrobiales bacterium]
MSKQPSQPDHKFAYSIEEAAELLSIKRDSLYELIQSDKLGSFKVGTRRLIAGDDLLAYVRSRQDAA